MDTKKFRLDDVINTDIYTHRTDIRGTCVYDSVGGGRGEAIKSHIPTFPKGELDYTNPYNLIDDKPYSIWLLKGRRGGGHVDFLVGNYWVK